MEEEAQCVLGHTYSWVNRTRLSWLTSSVRSLSSSFSLCLSDECYLYVECMFVLMVILSLQARLSSSQRLSRISQIFTLIQFYNKRFRSRGHLTDKLSYQTYNQVKLGVILIWSPSVLSHSCKDKSCRSGFDGRPGCHLHPLTSEELLHTFSSHYLKYFSPGVFTPRKWGTIVAER